MEFTKTDLNKTLWVKRADQEKNRKRYKVDATWLTLWRLAVDIANKLMWKDMVFSLEHHLKFATADQPFEQIKDSCEFVYKNVGEAFVDSVKNAKIMLSQAGYTEADEGNFIKEGV